MRGAEMFSARPTSQNLAKCSRVRYNLLLSQAENFSASSRNNCRTGITRPPQTKFQVEKTVFIKIDFY